MKIKKSKNRKKYTVKRKLKFEDYKYCLEATQLENKYKTMWIIFEKIIHNL